MGNVFFGNTNAKGNGGGNGSISFTRTLNATIGFEDSMCMFFANKMQDVEEYANEGNDYAVVIKSDSNGTAGQIVYDPFLPSSGSSPSTGIENKGGNLLFIDRTFSYSEMWGYKKFIDEDNIERYGLWQYTGGNPYISITVRVGEKQNLSGQSQTLKVHSRVVILLWDTTADEYVAFDTGETSATASGSGTIAADYYARNGGVAIKFDANRYIICGVQVKYCYYENLNAPSQE